MTIIILAIFILTFCRAKIVRDNEEYLSKKNTNIIKGLFVFFVFLSHFIQYKTPFSDNWFDTIGLKLISKMGQLMVVMFLFYSGYGIMESAKKKGEDYIKNIPKKRILPTWINFAIAVLIYMLVSVFVLNNANFSIKKMILSLIGWSGFGNSNWYIFTILILYFITYLSLKSFKSNKERICSMLIGTLLYTMIMKFYKQPYWYNTAFCYPLGMIFSMYKEKIEKWINDKDLVSIIYCIVFFVITYKLRSNIVWYEINTLIFALTIVLLTRKIQITNVVVEWMGRNLFPLYIFQRLPMMLLDRVEFMHNNSYVFLGVAAISTLLITFIYNGMMILVSNLIKRIKLNTRK